MKTHWKKHFDYRFLSGEELDGKEIKVKIIKVTTEQAFNGKEKEDVPVLHFEGKDKGVVLNRTNAKTISQVLGSPFVEDWIGKEITLYSTEVQAFGQTVPAIRVKRTASPKAMEGLR